MKAAAFIAVCSALSVVSARQFINEGSRGDPVKKVVRMLTELGEKLEAEAKAEKKLYKKFVCWGTSTVDTKTKAVTVANDRISYLKSYIADIAAGKIWFTSEKDKAEKEIAKLNKIISDNNATRTNETLAFQAKANASITGINGLTTGVSALKNLSAGKSLLALRGSLNSGVEGRLELAADLQTTLRLGEEYLSAADFVFLRDVLSGRVVEVDAQAPPKQAPSSPDAKANIVGKYQSRLGSVIDQLQKLQQNMVESLAADTKANKDSAEVFIKRHNLKAEEHKASVLLLQKLEAENAARQENTLKSQAEIDSLTAQVAADQLQIKEVTAALEVKAKEWDERSQYRADEQSALGKALEILQSDDARDLFARTASFLQISSESEVFTQRASLARNELIKGGQDSQDHRLLVLAVSIARAAKGRSISLLEQPNATQAGGNTSTSAGPRKNPQLSTLGAVVGKIDEMTKALMTEENSDLKKKEDCTKTKNEDLSAEKGYNNKLADINSTSSFLQVKLDDIAASIQKKIDQIAEADAAIKNAAAMRETETKAYSAEKQDNQAAIQLIQQATKVVQDFYDKKKPSFIQTDDVSFLQTDEEESPKAADPPKTWQGSYGGAGAQSVGVVQTMLVVADDIQKQLLVADAEENKAQGLFNTLKQQLLDKITALGKDKDTLVIQKASVQADSEAKQKDLNATSLLLATLNKKMADAEPECKFYFDNYDARRKNRITEMNSLAKAKAILSGGLFEAPSLLTIGESLVEIAPYVQRLRR